MPSDRIDPRQAHTIPPLHVAWRPDCVRQWHEAVEAGDDRLYADWARRWGMALTGEQWRAAR